MPSQLDNAGLNQKLALRRNALREVESARVVETHGGIGKIFDNLYRDLPGIVFENDIAKAEKLCAQRNWPVYASDCVSGIAGGACDWFRPNYWDLDPYGCPWNVVDAILSRPQPSRFVLVANDGLRLKLKMGGVHMMKFITDALRHFGERALRTNYAEACEWIVRQRAAAVGLRLARWAAHYGGYLQQMTHWCAVLDTVVPSPRRGSSHAP